MVFVPGFLSCSQGNKSQRLLAHCRDRGYEYVCYDPEGVGESPADWESLEFSHWQEDAEIAAGRILSQRLVLVGSSLGGLNAVKIAMKRDLHALVKLFFLFSGKK